MEIIIIMGATGGIGQAVALELSKHNNLLLIARNNGKLEALNLKSHHNFYKFCYDLEEFNEERLLQFIQENNFKVKGYINCCGQISVQNIHKETNENIKSLLDINLLAQIRLIKSLLPQMEENGGHIIFINGIFSKTPNPNFIINSSIAGAIVNFAKALSKALSPYKVNVNVVNPALTDTNLIDVISSQFGLTREKFIANAVDHHPQKRINLPQDIANTVSFLLTDNARNINGTVINIDGGSVDAI